MKNSNVWVCFALVTVLLTSCSNSEKEGVVISIENAKVFENFQMKKDYDKQLEKDLFVESSRMDSLGKMIQNMQKSGNAEQVINAKKNEFLNAQQIFNQRFEKLSKEYTSQVYGRLNEYLATYGKEKHIRLIVGANGQGNVMYVDKTADKTQEVIEYVNKKYQNN